MLRPPSPPKPNARQYPRFDLSVSVEVRHGHTTLVLPARNISLGGIYLAADGKRLNRLRVGETVEVTVFDLLDEAKHMIRTTARVVRNEGQGIGLSWSTTDPVLSAQVTSILDRLSRR